MRYRLSETLITLLTINASTFERYQNHWIRQAYQDRVELSASRSEVSPVVAVEKIQGHHERNEELLFLWSESKGLSSQIQAANLPVFQQVLCVSLESIVSHVQNIAAVGILQGLGRILFYHEY